MAPQSDKLYRVWRSLDADTSYFGIRGRFLLLFVIMAFMCVLITALVWPHAGDIIGMLLLGASLVMSYMAILGIQNRFTSREFERMLNRWKCTRFLRMGPVSLRSYFNSNSFKWK